MSKEPTWVVMPFIDLWREFTLQAAVDVLSQTVPCRLLLVDNGSGEEDRRAADEWLQSRGSWVDHRALIWHHDPPLPTLDATWNRALEAAWEAGAERALVVNNDVRLHRSTLEVLTDIMLETGALFVSAVNVGEAYDHEKEFAAVSRDSRGGPDYSCFLISKECHQRFPFDPKFTYCGDLDHHRRIMLAGEGKRIFGVCVPYLHYASRTVVRHPKLALAADEHRRLYREKWGGDVNQERWRKPYAGVDPHRLHLTAEEMQADLVVVGGEEVGGSGVTTPELQRACLEG